MLFCALPPHSLTLSILIRTLSSYFTEDAAVTNDLTLSSHIVFLEWCAVAFIGDE